MDKNEIKKDLFRSKAMAKFSHYVSGNLYYKVQLLDGDYQFPIATVQDNQNDAYKSYLLSEDLGTTSFSSEIRGSELIRWITKAIDSEQFIKVA